MPAPRVLFLTLSTFSTTGGIEKVCRIAAKALSELAAQRNGQARLLSMYDRDADVLAQYISPSSFKGYSQQRLRFIKDAVQEGRSASHVVLSHINLLVVGFLIKLFSPGTKVFLIAHGIEVWVALPSWKKAILKKLDGVLPVSSFTKQRMTELYGLSPEKLTVVNNCLDPYLQTSATPEEIEAMRQMHGVQTGEKVLFTLARLSHSEQYKGYDKVIRVLPEVLKLNPEVKYLIAGKYDADEKKRLDAIISELHLSEKVVFTGFVPDGEVEALFRAADVYVMPSKGEGFGVVFIEALFYGLPVIAGNRDGSVDAVGGGQFGQLVDPDDADALTAAIRLFLNNSQKLPALEEVNATFGFDAYKARLAQAIDLI